MIGRISVAFFVVAWMSDGSAAINRAVAAPLHTVALMPAHAPTEISARRYTRHTRSVDRPQDQLYYIDQPRYYAPAPFVPLNYGYVFWPRIF
jgi:hypothetical protein